MQLSDDTDLDAAVAATDRYIVHKFEVDWNKNGGYDHTLSNLTEVVTGIQVERSVTGALPAEVTLIEGYTAAKATAQLGGLLPGQFQTLALLLAPWRTASPLFAKGKVAIPVRWWATARKADGTVDLIRQFTGLITEFQIDSRARTVSLVLMDPAATTNASITLPLGGLPDQGQALNRTQDFRMNSQWVIDYVLRQNGIYATYPQMTGCIWSMTGHGSMVPEKGFHYSIVTGLGSATEDDQVHSPGRFDGMLAITGNDRFVPSAVSRAEGAFRPIPGEVWTVQAEVNYEQAYNPLADGTVIAVSSGRGAFDGTTMALRVVSGALYVEFYNGTTKAYSFTQITDNNWANWKHIGATVTFGTGMTGCTIRHYVDGVAVTQSAVNLSTLPASPTIHSWATVTVQAPFPIANLQINRANETSLYDEFGWSPQCYLDPGLNEFNTLPIVENKPSWELLKEVVGVEFGVMGFDENGFFSFKNRNTVRRQALAINKSLHADGALQGLTVTERLESVRNVVEIETQERWITISKYSTVYTAEAGTELAFPPGLSRIFVTLDEPCLLNDAINLTRYTTAQWNDQNPTGGFVALKSDTLAETSNVAVAVYAMVDGRSAQIDVQNSETVPIKMATTDGKVAFRLEGTVFVESGKVTAQYRRDSSVTTFGERVLTLNASPWYQRQRPLEKVALSLLKDLKRPVPIVEQIPTRGDPRLQLLDTADLNDPGGLGEVYVSVDGIVRAWSRDRGLTEQLTVRPYSAPGAWILGHPTLSILNVTTIPG